MRESTYYQSILEEGREEGRAIGREEGAVEILEEVASERFGPPSTTIAQRLAELHDLKKIARLTARIPRVSSWDELLEDNQ